MVAYLSAGCMPGRLVGRYVGEPARASPDGEMVVGTEHLNGSHHVVQFYGHDDELTERVAGCLRRALEDGGAAIVIATPKHRHEFEARLIQAGVDLAAARDGGAYLALDAGQTLRELVAADGLDRAAFDRVIGGLIRQAGAGARARRGADVRLFSRRARGGPPFRRRHAAWLGGRGHRR